jgi:hypothetical protein
VEQRIRFKDGPSKRDYSTTIFLETQISNGISKATKKMTNESVLDLEVFSERVIEIQL